MAKLPRYLFPSDYMADPSANVFNGKLFIYPSHDWDAGECFDDDGGHFQMKDYHVLSWDDIENGEVTDHGVILDVKDVPWAEKQMWDNDCVEKDGRHPRGGGGLPGQDLRGTGLDRGSSRPHRVPAPPAGRPAAGRSPGAGRGGGLGGKQHDETTDQSRPAHGSGPYYLRSGLLDSLPLGTIGIYCL